MHETHCPVLCGGTFFTLVLQARKPGASSRNHAKGRKDNFKESDVLETLAKIAIPELRKKITRSGCSEFKSCKKSFSAVTGTDLQPEYCKEFDIRVKTQYALVLNAMEKFAEQYISSSEDTQKRCVRSLLELICEDKSIPENQIFYVNERGQALKEAALSGSKMDIYLPELLLGIWHFVVINREDNRIGATTFEMWHEKKSGSNPREKRLFISKIGDDYTGEINILSERFEESAGSAPLEPDLDDSTTQSDTPNDADIHVPQSEASVLAVPPECRICLCCYDWKGKTNCALLDPKGVYGDCDAHGRRTLSTASCDMFRADYGKVSLYQMLFKPLRSWRR